MAAAPHAVPVAAIPAVYTDDRAMEGQPPAIFNGMRLKTNQFMTEFQLWWMINNRSETMRNPFERIALCLSFIRGPEVDNWITGKINQLRHAVLGNPIEGLAPTHLDTDEALWNSFNTDLRSAFQDTAEEENAYAALKDLRMKEDQVDEYIAHFEVLLVKAGWQRTERGSADLFFNGLVKRVQRKILSLYVHLPTSLDECQAAARSVVQRQRLMDVKLGPWKPTEYRSNSKPKQHQGSQTSIRLPEKLKKRITTLLKRASSTPTVSQKDRSSKNHASSIQARDHKDKGSDRSPQKGQPRETHDLGTMKTYDPSAMDYDAITINLASTEERSEGKKKTTECTFCYQPGHTYKNCWKRCSRCHQLEHPTEKCPQCNSCHKPGHRTEKCHKRCGFCHKLGHLKKDCRRRKTKKFLEKVRTQVTTIEEAPPACDTRSLINRINQIKVEDRSKFVDHLLIESEEDRQRPGSPIYLRVTKDDAPRTQRVKAMHANFELSTMQQVTKERALLNSGASENLIDKDTWKTLGIGAFTLPRPITIYNVDGTENKQGKIT